MKQTHFIATILFSGILAMNASAQKSVTGKQVLKALNTGSKISTGIQKADSTVNIIKVAAVKGQKTVNDVLTILGGSKASNEATVVIPDIEFEDNNLGSLVKAIEARKEVNKVVVGYTDGIATINITLKGKAKFGFWGELPKETTVHFKMKSKDKNNLVVEYKGNNANNTQIASN